MTAGSDSRRVILGTVAGLLYGSVLVFLSIVAAGAGHGTIMPLLLSSAPLGLLLDREAGISDAMFYALLLGAPVMWAVLGSLAALSGRGVTRWLTPALALLHYASGLALLAIRGAGLQPSFVNIYVVAYILVWAAVYLVGQAALWWRVSRPVRRAN